MKLETIVWALVGIIGGTGFTSFLRYLSTRRVQSISLEEKLRAEMYDQIDGLKKELATLKQELDQWRDKYLNLNKEYTKLKSDFDKLVKDRNG